MEMNQHVMPTYGRLPVSFVKGDGAYLEDTAGNKYLEATKYNLDSCPEIIPKELKRDGIK